jgi:N-methylhydantoinase B
MAAKRDPILLEVFRNRFAAVAEEMGVTLMRTAFSPNIKERRDFSCALFDAAGDLVAQAEHIPVHLGAMPLSVRAVLDVTDFAPGDMVMVNDPFRGGTHLPDITLVAPVFAGTDSPVFFTANRAHHSDVGGMAAGSMPLSTSIFQEGVVVPPVKVVREGRIDRGVMDFFWPTCARRWSARAISRRRSWPI